jgi:hypothetical protein
LKNREHENKSQKVGKFLSVKTWRQHTTFCTQSTTNPPAIYHAFSPQISATPLKNTRKRRSFSPCTTPEKNCNFRQKFPADRPRPPAASNLGKEHAAISTIAN